MSSKLRSLLPLAVCAVVCIAAAATTGPRVLEGNSLTSVLGGKDDCDTPGLGFGVLCAPAPPAIVCGSKRLICAASSKGDNENICDEQGGPASSKCKADASCKNDNHDGLDGDCDDT
jgi:hypothetical protein